ncbi:class I SAM-dependent methyltransferase [Amycolatopsis acidiphila]|uniref:Methyltransferase domain-containing protein n=1 Tax=Amycolatopsis acidiphila TaxID=715473 RepID=A0A558A9G3_9PSEU|nr:class I SAM-dependent methyltransferase [Amycolatopsis acidiphila]TVT20900.1 methyltransferase domain-containing protein [Amycolatopsis acidiphila]UIJ63004.1 class I SAM-dependent methyltransferase [Amycolatopsis acidiphila]GHG65590.1 ubiquinone/menaquinone biosynthesis methyltransferase [Amycolatopsis acidiphila]
MTLSAAFDRGARAYDRLVGLNPGYHDHLRRSAAAVPAGARRVLDGGCGTGASTAALLGVVPDAEIVGVDASAGMLAEARRKQWPDKVSFVHSRVEHLAEAGVTGPFDAIFAGYLIRNLPDPAATLTAMLGLLRPGGVLVVHDYSVADSLRARLTWHAVCWSVIIPMGRVVSGDAGLYRYLWRSVLDFDGATEFAARLRRTGFADVRTSTMTGWQRGIVHTFRAEKP